MTTEQAPPKRRWRPRFSLLTLVLGVVFAGACGGLWYRWEPWGCNLSLKGVVLDGSRGISPDGRWIVTGDSDDSVCLYDSATGQLRAVLKGHTSWIKSTGFSYDGQWIVTASQDGTARGDIGDVLGILFIINIL